MKRHILVTSALPYANGHIHIGHLVEYLQTDIWVRFQKLRGNRCIYICADDTHGTAIMLKAASENVTPESFIERMSAAHQADFAGFDIEFDEYGSTNSDDNRQICYEIWQGVRNSNLIEERDVEQLFDVNANTFLADRFVKGTCPKCGKKDQYGDNCECGATYSPTDLIDPISTISGTKPEMRTAKHLFVEIERLHDFLNDWTQNGHTLQPEMAHYLAGQFLHEPLRPWDVSRPAPYFGFEIPDSPGNFFYVWYDAPIGYIGTTLSWTKKNNESFDFWWREGGSAGILPAPGNAGFQPACGQDARVPREIHHFLGKDIAYFHTLFWPAMLKAAGFNLPTKVHVHGFLTVNGEKMSKSRGTFIMASDYLKHLDPAYLRYFFATKLSRHVDDIDLNFDEIEAKVNADLIGNLVNLASRTAKFVGGAANSVHGLSPTYPNDNGLFEQGIEAGKQIAEHYENCEYGKAMRLIMECGNRANKYVEDNAPWVLKKQAGKEKELQDVCSIGLNLFRQMAIYISPVLPRLRKQIERLFNTSVNGWDDAYVPLTGTAVSEYEHLLTRMQKEGITKMIDETTSGNAGILPASGDAGFQPASRQDACVPSEPLLTDLCGIDDFTKIDLRIARVLEASEIPEAKKLLRIKLHLGGDVYKNVFAGIKAAYKPESLIGRLVVCVANLQPRQMKFGVSEGMIVCAGPGGNEIFIISPDEGAQPGMRLH